MDSKWDQAACQVSLPDWITSVVYSPPARLRGRPNKSLASSLTPLKTQSSCFFEELYGDLTWIFPPEKFMFVMFSFERESASEFRKKRMLFFKKNITWLFTFLSIATKKTLIVMGYLLMVFWKLELVSGCIFATFINVWRNLRLELFYLIQDDLQREKSYFFQWQDSSVRFSYLIRFYLAYVGICSHFELLRFWWTYRFFRGEEGICF